MAFGDRIKRAIRRARQGYNTGGGPARERAKRRPAEDARRQAERERAGRGPLLSDYTHSGRSRNEAERMYEDAKARYNQERIAGLEEYLPTGENLDYEVSFEDDTGMYLPDSVAGQAQADAADIDAQRRALANLEGIYEGGGYTDVERGQIEQAMQQSRALERAGTLAAQQQAAARGMIGAGSQMAAQLAAQQGAMNRGRTASTNIAAAGQQRALQALQGAGNLGTRMRGQSFDEAFQRGSAIDSFARNDMDYRRAREARRAAAQTMANEYGTTARQNFAQQNFGNRRGLVEMETGQRASDDASYYNTRARQDAARMANWNAFANMVGGAVDAGTGVAAAFDGDDSGGKQSS